MSIGVKSFFILYLILFSLVGNHAIAASTQNLHHQRTETIKQYVNFLGKGKYQSIILLFAANGRCVSSSGHPDNPSHFYETLFTKTISNPRAKLVNVFDGQLNQDMMAAYFDFSWKNEQGQQVTAKFLDLFLFEKDTAKIQEVDVFSNTFQKDIMKQLG